METTADGAGTTICSECNGVFPADDIIRLGESLICARCKPGFIQKLAEGASIRKGVQYVGFWWRLLASLIDGTLMYVVNILLALVVGFLGRMYIGTSPTDSVATVLITLLPAAIGLLIGLSYDVFFIGRYGATLGKQICKIRVVRSDGTRVTYLLALGRYFAKILSGLIIGIGYIMAAFDSEKRGLHDFICDTRVIDKFEFKASNSLFN